MTERLEEIKEAYRWTIDNSLVPRLSDSDTEWLIEQAERVQELEEEVEKQKNRKYLKMRQRDDFMKKAQHYKQELEEILNADCNLEGLDAERELDRVTDIALKALEGEK